MYSIKNFILRILCDLTMICSSIKALETTCGSKLAMFGHYGILSVKWSFEYILIVFMYVHLWMNFIWNHMSAIYLTH